MARISIELKEFCSLLPAFGARFKTKCWGRYRILRAGFLGSVKKDEAGLRRENIRSAKEEMYLPDGRWRQ